MADNAFQVIAGFSSKIILEVPSLVQRVLNSAMLTDDLLRSGKMPKRQVSIKVSTDDRITQVERQC